MHAVPGGAEIFDAFWEMQFSSSTPKLLYPCDVLVNSKSPWASADTRRQSATPQYNTAAADCIDGNKSSALAVPAYASGAAMKASLRVLYVGLC